MKKKTEKRMKNLLLMLMGAMISVFIISGYVGNRVSYAAIAEWEQEYADEITPEITSIVYNAEKKTLEVWAATGLSYMEIQVAENEGFSKNLKIVKANELEESEDLFKPDVAVKGIKPGKTYYVRVRGYMNSEDGQDLVYGRYSKAYKIKTAALKKVENVSVSNPKKGEVKVTWKKLKNPKGYKKVFYYVSLCWDKQEIHELDGYDVRDENSVSFKKLKKGKTYYINIYAYCTTNNKPVNSKTVVECKGKRITKKIKITK